ncbi:filamentous hemagglutinin N-terminal domain-containing protein, partial [Geitlerinema calcuttense]
MKSAYRKNTETPAGASLWMALSQFAPCDFWNRLAKQTAKCGALPVVACLISPQAYAQIIPAHDGTGTINRQQGDRFEITGGRRSSDRSNLFHSFTQFNLDRNQSALFLSPPDVRNILGRINGGDPSIINGLIQVTGSPANLYLMNPAGLIFGPNAQLNVPGSFTATTAHQISFGNLQGFTATGVNSYANLVGNPTAFHFNALPTGTIINQGNLAVSPGQSLSFIGGTIVSTGNLSAPQGEINLIAVPGENVVRISQKDHILSLEIPLPSDPNSIAPLSLPQLLTSGHLGNHATEFSLTPNGEVQLTGSGIQIERGDVIVSRSSVAAQTAHFLASNQLKLSESHIQTTGDLTLFANQVIQIRDSLERSFLANAGGNLILQGNQMIDILALNHLQTPFVSGGNLRLISGGIISGDAQFQAGRNFELLNLTGEGGEFISLFDPIIRSNGDVIFGDYTGVSLKIESQGSITGGNITITAPDAAVPSNDPDSALLQSEKAIILRAGVAALSDVPNLPPEQASGNTTFIPGIQASSPGRIVVNNLNTSGTTNGLANGGPIILSAPGDILINNINSGSNVGNGGSIFVESTNGSLQISGLINSSSQTGQGGAVTLRALGDIDISAINAQSGSAGTGNNSIQISTPGLLRASGTFLDRNGFNVSLSTAGGDTGGNIRIEHGGGERQIPFTVGDPQLNGTAGAIATSPENAILPLASFLESYFQSNIQILTTSLPPTPPTPPTPPPPPT